MTEHSLQRIINLLNIAELTIAEAYNDLPYGQNEDKELRHHVTRALEGVTNARDFATARLERSSSDRQR